MYILLPHALSLASPVTSHTHSCFTLCSTHSLFFHYLLRPPHSLCAPTSPFTMCSDSCLTQRSQSLLKTLCFAYICVHQVHLPRPPCRMNVSIYIHMCMYESRVSLKLFASRLLRHTLPRASHRRVAIACVKTYTTCSYTYVCNLLMSKASHTHTCNERWGAGVEYYFQEFHEPYAPS